MFTSIEENSFADIANATTTKISVFLNDYAIAI